MIWYKRAAIFSFEKQANDFTILPGTDGGTRLCNKVSVYSATFSGVALSGDSAPGVTMLKLQQNALKQDIVLSQEEEDL
jgi:hypothetical protein